MLPEAPISAKTCGIFFYFQPFGFQHRQKGVTGMNREDVLVNRIRAETVSFSGRLSLYANDFKGGEIAVDADEPFETASCIKTYILATLFSEIAKNRKSLSDELIYTKDNFVGGSGILQSLEEGTRLSVKNLATLMIIVSDNIATNLMIDYLGIDTVNSTIRGLGLTKTELFNKLDFKKYKCLGTTTPREYGKMFEWIHNRELISPQASDEMLAIFRQQHYNSMLVRDFPQKYLDEDLTDSENLIYTASKSGSMDACRNDGGIVFTPCGSYVAVIFTKDFHDPVEYADHEAMRFGGKVSRLLLDQYLALEGRFFH
jgi:beta-lactamase class A